MLPQSRSKSPVKFPDLTNWHGSKRKNASTFHVSCRSHCVRNRSPEQRRIGFRRNSDRGAQAIWRHHWDRRRLSGIHGGAVPPLFSWATQQDELILRSHWRDGKHFE